MSFYPSGSALALGSTTGDIVVLDAEKLMLISTFKVCSSKIESIHFSEDSQYLAATDADYAVALFKINPLSGSGRISDGTNPVLWKFVGQQRAHFAHIIFVSFGKLERQDEAFMFTISEDRHIVEFGVVNGMPNSLVILSRKCIEQVAVPKSICSYHGSMEPLLLIASNDYKLKFFNLSRRVYQKTILGPFHGLPLSRMQVLMNSDGVEAEILLYATSKQIGIGVMPLDGNPHRYVAIKDHPSGISKIECCLHSRSIFTSSVQNGGIHMWHPNIKAVHRATNLGGDGMTPFFNLLPGGIKGQFFKDILDYFCSVQIESQRNTHCPYQLSTKIPLLAVPRIMRAIGYYPTEEEIKNMTNEVHMSSFREFGKMTVDVDLEYFIRLYINYRPVSGTRLEELIWAFSLLAARSSDKIHAMSRRDFVQPLLQSGETMSEKELTECLTTLLDRDSRPLSRRSSVPFSDPVAFRAGSSAGHLVQALLPEEVSLQYFLEEILGLSAKTTSDTS